MLDLNKINGQEMIKLIMNNVLLMFCYSPEHSEDRGRGWSFEELLI